MNKKLFIIFLIFSIKTYGQKYFIPYIENDKVGLINEKGKKVIPATYDAISWGEDSFFIAENETYVTDTLNIDNHYYIRQNEKTVRYSIIHNGKIILDNLPHSRYEFLLNKLVIAQFGSIQNAHNEQISHYNLPQRECITLFNTKGENLYPEHFYKLQKIDTSGILHKGHLKTRYILFASIDLQQKYSLFAYDLETGKISDWFIKNAEKIHFKDVDYQSKSILFEITDENYVTSYKTLNYLHSNFKLIDTIDNHLSEGTRDYPDERYVSVTDYDGSSMQVGEDSAKPSYTQKELVANTQKELFPILRVNQDSLFFYPDRYDYKNKKHVKLKDNQRIINRNNNNYTAVIIQEDAQFRFLDLRETLSKAYDSLFYYGNHFVAKLDGKFGIIDENDIAVIPFEFDKFQFNLLKLELDYKDDGFQLIHKVPYDYSRNKPNTFEITSKDYIQAHKNGKVGVFSKNFRLLLPVEYDYVVKNGIQYMRPQHETRYIAKKGDNYFVFNSMDVNSIKEQSIPFNYIPIYYYENYYGIKGMTVFALYDDQYNFKGFVSSEGEKYYK